MIALTDTEKNEYTGSVVLEDGEQALLVKLMFGNSPVDTLRLAQTTLGDAVSSLLAWCGHHNLIDASASALSSAVRLEFPSLQRHRDHGPDACLDWPGSRSERRAVHARS